MNVCKTNNNLKDAENKKPNQKENSFFHVGVVVYPNFCFVKQTDNVYNAFMLKSSPLTYAHSGVSYESMDPIKRLAQTVGRRTSAHLKNAGTPELDFSRGESAFVWEEGNVYRSLVMEGLGSKNLVADEMRAVTGRSYYDSIAQDTVAMIVNDLITVGARPQVVTAYFAIGNSDWMLDQQRAEDLLRGWAHACDLAGATWGGGETPTLKGIVNPNTIDLAGSCVGIIEPKNRLTLGEKLLAGDAIVFIESSGIHANGLTLARAIADNLPNRFATKMQNDEMYGEALLTPTHIYARAIADLFEHGIDIHYMANITGHGWRKLMRARQNFSYVISEVPEAQPLFHFIQQQTKSSDEEMYGNFNMGAGFALYLPQKDVKKAQRVLQNNGFQSWHAGSVEKGKKQVVIKSKKITFAAESLGVR
jgi:phosphoribosylformylglycinamidine cyclo-ligase